MNNPTLFRYGGIAAILSAILSVAFPVFFLSGYEFLATISFIIASLLSLVVLVPLYLDLQTDFQQLSLTALILLVGTSILGLFFDDPVAAPIIWGLLSVGTGLGYALFGWLQYRSSHYPNGMGLVAVITGILIVLSGILVMAGVNPDTIAGPIILMITVTLVIWLGWLGWYYLKGRSANPQLA